MTKKKKPKRPKKRNPMALPAKMKTGAGTHRNKTSKRAKENKNSDFVEEDGK